MSAKQRSTKRVAIAGAVAALLGVVTVLAVTGSREPASALKLLPGDAWLGNGNAGSVSHVYGYSGKVDGTVAVSHPGDPFTIVQRPDGAYVLDLKTGRLTRVGTAGLDTTASRQLSGKASALQILTSASSTWVLDRSSGVLQQENAATLVPEGPQIPLGAATGSATLDAEGNVWVPIPSEGTVREVSAANDAITNHPQGQPGDQLQVATTSNGVWVVDPQAGRAVSLSQPSVTPLQIPQTATNDSPLIASSVDNPNLAIVEGDRFLDIDTGRPSLSSTTSPNYAGAVQIALNGDTAYVLDESADQLDAVNLNPLSPGRTVAVPAGSDQLVTKDDLVFVNNVNSPQALVVSNTGQVAPVTKYIPAVTAPNPSSSLASDPIPAPGGPAPAGTNGGPSGPQPGGAGTAPGVATPVTVPPIPGPGSGSMPPTTAPTPTAPISPSAPGAPTVTSVTPTAGSLTVNWSAPASSGSSPISSYKLTVTNSTGGDAQPHGTTTGGTATTGAVGGLKGGLRYCAVVQAVNATGGGPTSLNDGTSTVCATTTNDTPGTVATPSVTGGPTSVAVSWAAASDGPYNTPITGYTVTASPSGGGKAVTQTVTGRTSTTIKGLSAGTTYDVTVLATNASGNNGTASSAAAATTDDDPKGFAITVDATNAGELTATWTPQKLNNGQSLTYTATAGGTRGSVSGSKAVFTGLGGGSYTVIVTATASGGGTATGSGPGDVWVRVPAVYSCYSTDKFDYWVLTDSGCGQTPTGGKVINEGSAGFVWPSSTAAPGVVPLMDSYGTADGPNNPASGSHWYYTGGASTPPGPWIETVPGSTIGYVWTSAAAAPSGATHLCEEEVTSAQGTHFFMLYPYGGSHTSCTSQFWS